MPSGPRLQLRAIILRLVPAVLLMPLLVLTHGAGADDFSRKVVFDIPAQPLSTALVQFADQAGVQFTAPGTLLDRFRTHGVHGKYLPGTALAMMLRETGLTYRIVDPHTVAISMPGASPRSSTAAPAGGKEGKRSSSDPFRVAQTDRGAPAVAPAIGEAGSGGGRQSAELQEVVVTAEKRRELLINVPMSMAALSGGDLARSHSFRLEDFAGSVPGLTLSSYNGIGNQLVIRGITAGSVPINAGVATYVDETPYTSEGPFAAPIISTPDVDAYDMQRIEVLRGPQGTLYGANALAGILKYVTNPPDPTHFASSIESGVSSVDKGGVGFDVHGMLNVPLSGNAALRVVGYDNYYPGFIDDPSRGLRDTNGSHYAGGRASFLYRTSAGLSVRLNALYQDRKWADYPAEDVVAGTLAPEYGNFIHQQLINNKGHATTEIYNATVDWQTSLVHLVSATSYYELHPHALYEYPTLNGVISSIFGPPYAGAAVGYNEPVQALTQELRLSSAGSGPLDWLLGGYFTNESANASQLIEPIDANTHTAVSDFPTPIGTFYLPAHYREYAVFANVDYQLTQTLDASLGGRYSRNHQSFHETQLGLFGGPSIDNTSSEGVVTYSGDLRWRFRPHDMVYARVASGFVPGGPNDVFAGSTLPSTYRSSTTVNYEVGVKSALLNGLARAELSVFDIDWRDIQLIAVINGLGGITNAGNATSRGFEAGLTYDPRPGLTLGVNAAYTDAYLTTATPASVNGRVGDRLPAVSKWQLSASAAYERPLGGEYSGFVGGNWRYAGSRYSDFVAGSPRQLMPWYEIVDLRIGIETDHWSATLYAKNVTNELAILSLQPETLAGGTGPQEATVYTPRTIGLSLTATFD